MDKQIMSNISQQVEQEFISTAMKLKLKGIEKGIEKGMEKEKRIVAISLITQDIDDKIIIEATGLSKKQLAFLKKSLV